jgi:hypothetical protein
VAENPHYKVFGLPNGARLNGDQIEVSLDVEERNYLVRVQALNGEDEIMVEGLISLHVVFLSQEEEAKETREGSETVDGDSAVSDERLTEVISSYSTVTKIEERAEY